MTALLILHGLLAVVLIGALTHQAVAGALKRAEVRGRQIYARLRATDASLYTNIVVALYIAVAVLGAVLYPRYRSVVRPLVQTMDLRTANGAFELKEHFSALGLLLLPGYWAAWKQPAGADYQAARLWLTWIMAGFVWWNFVTGQWLVAIKGLFT